MIVERCVDQHQRIPRAKRTVEAPRAMLKLARYRENQR